MMPMGGLGLQPTWKEIFNHPVIQVFVCFLDLCGFAFHFYFYLKCGIRRKENCPNFGQFPW
jgi:hypothetical protein